MTGAALNKATAILREAPDLTIATLWPDGAPHAVTVSYVSEGLDIYFGCSPSSQKARNLEGDDRVALTVNLPYRDWSEIQGLSISGHARRLTDVREIEQVALMFARKFEELAQYVSGSTEELALFRVTPTFVSVLDYREGFGHVEALAKSDLRRTKRTAQDLRIK